MTTPEAEHDQENLPPQIPTEPDELSVSRSQRSPSEGGDEQTSAENGITAAVYSPTLPASERKSEPHTRSPERSFEDLTLAEAIGEFFRKPVATYQAIMAVASSTVNFPNRNPDPVISPSTTYTDPVMSVSQFIGGISTRPYTPYVEDVRFIPEETGFTRDLSKRSSGDADLFLPDVRRQRMMVGLYISAFVLAFWGCLILVSAETRYEASQLRRGSPMILLGFIIWAGAELYRDWPTLKARWGQRRNHNGEEDSTDTGDSFEETDEAQERNRQIVPESGMIWEGMHPIRVFGAIGVVGFGVLAWFGTANNEFTALGSWAWLAAILSALVSVAPASWSPFEWTQGLRHWGNGFGIPFTGTTAAVVAIFLLGAFFRFNNLEGVPPEMTSDHMEKLLDSQRVVDGDRDVFFTNNGGREAFQMYAMAFLSYLPGLDINFDTLKLLAVVESLITLPILYWMGRAIIGERHSRLGNIVGLALMALIAVSYWHVAVTRLSLRIVLTPLVMALLLIFLSRAMRYNRRSDFIIAGLVLGFGLYTYQAVRMMPLVVLAGIGLAILYHWRDTKMRWRYVRNLAVLVMVSFVVFIPLFRFSVDYPDAFWMRTAGRLLGDSVIQEEDAAGNIRLRNATVEERLDALGRNLPVLMGNIRNAFLMFNWKGDVAWINGVPNYPEMDSITGAFLIVGVAAWFSMSIRRRDPVYLLIPITVFIMLLPSALSIAAPLENPSATRASGVIPPAYLIAALPLSLIALYLWRVLPGRMGYGMAVGAAVLAIGGAYVVNSDVYLNDYLASYRHSWKSHSAPGQVLEGFVESDGGFGNAFLIHFPYWLDHRIVGAEAGILDWTNGVADLIGNRSPVAYIPDFLHDAWRCVGNPYRLDPEKDLLFFVHREDAETIAQLQAWFPNGRQTLIEQPDIKDEFRIYRVPAPGVEAMADWLAEHTVNPRCTG